MNFHQAENFRLHQTLRPSQGEKGQRGRLAEFAKESCLALRLGQALPFPPVLKQEPGLQSKGGISETTSVNSSGTCRAPCRLVIQSFTLVSICSQIKVHQLHTKCWLRLESQPCSCPCCSSSRNRAVRGRLNLPGTQADCPYTDCARQSRFHSLLHLGHGVPCSPMLISEARLLSESTPESHSLAEFGRHDRIGESRSLVDVAKDLITARIKSVFPCQCVRKASIFPRSD